MSPFIVTYAPFVICTCISMPFFLANLRVVDTVLTDVANL